MRIVLCVTLLVCFTLLVDAFPKKDKKEEKEEEKEGYGGMDMKLWKPLKYLYLLVHQFFTFPFFHQMMRRSKMGAMKKQPWLQRKRLTKVMGMMEGMATKMVGIQMGMVGIKMGMVSLPVGMRKKQNRKERMEGMKQMQGETVN